MKEPTEHLKALVISAFNGTHQLTLPELIGRLPKNTTKLDLELALRSLKLEGRLGTSERTPFPTTYTLKEVKND